MPNDDLDNKIGELWNAVLLSTPSNFKCSETAITGDRPTPENIADVMMEFMSEVCAKDLPEGQLKFTFNHVSLLLTMTIKDSRTRQSHCYRALGQIISNCILGEKKYGGIWELDGQTYDLVNELGDWDVVFVGPSMLGWLEVRARNSRFCCCGVRMN